MQLANAADITGSHISYFSNLVKQHGGINLAQGIPGFMPPKGLLNILKEITHQQVHQYAPGIGNLELLEHLKQRYAAKHNPETSQFLVTNGATEAISLIYTYLHTLHHKNMRVLALSPAYESYTNLPRIFGDHLSLMQLSDKGTIDTDMLEFLVSKDQINLLFVSSPGNPWGVIPDQQTMDALVEICERHQCYLMIDAVYSELYFSPNPPYYPIARQSPQVFYVNSFSKLLSVTGWRVGYLLTHQQHYDALRGVHDYTGLCSPAPFQLAIARFLQQKKEVNTYVEEVREAIRQNIAIGRKQLEANGFIISEHHGGYFLWAKCPVNIASGTDFGVELYNQHRTAVIPGAHFGSEWEQYVRINMAMPYGTVQKGLDAITRLAGNRSPRG
jgi:aspartate/methionine/tyrosine aminotransferase